MKKFAIMCFVLSGLFFTSCDNNESNSQQSVSTLNAKVQELNSTYSQNTVASKVDPVKVRHLLSADALGAVGSWGWASTPIIGGYIVLWSSFGTSYHACTWCRPLQNVSTAIQNGNLVEVENLLSASEELVYNDNKNPFNWMGKSHNRLMTQVAANDSLMITTDDKLSVQAKQYLLTTSDLNFTSAERETIISAVESNISFIKASVDTESTNVDKILNENDLSVTTNDIIRNIYTFVTSSTIGDSELRSYFSEVENLVLADELLEKSDKDALLRFIAVAKYSHAFWSVADNLKV